MFGIGSTELLVILVVALIVLGPKSIPGIAKTLGKVMGEFRRVSTEFQRTMNAEVAQDEHEKRKKEAEEELFGTKLKAEAAAAQAEAAPPKPENAPPKPENAPPKPENAPPKPENAPQPYTMQTQEPATAAAPVAPAAPDVSTPASAATVDAAPIDATTGVPLNPESPLAQAVARAEAEARGETLPIADPSTAQIAAEHIKSGEKA